MTQRFLQFLILIIFYSFHSKADLTYEGFLYDLNGSPITSVSLINVKILSPDSNACTLYENIYSVTPNSEGYFSINLTDSGRIDSNTQRALSSLFNNDKIFNSLSCLSGTTYTPAATDQRVLDISVSADSGATWDHLGQSNITDVPSSMTTRSLNGYSEQNLCRVADSNIPQSVSPLSSAHFTELLALINGSSTQYVKPSDSVNNIHGASIPAVASGESIRWNTTLNSGAGGWEAFTPGSSTSVTNVSSANSDISVTNSTTTPVLTLNSGNGANQIVKLDSISRLPAVDGSLLTNLNALSNASTFSGDISGTSSTLNVNKIKGISVGTLPTISGQVLRYDGTSAYQGSFLSMADIRSTANPANTILPTVNCSSAQTLSWSSLTDSMTCVNISISSSQISAGTLLLANGGTGSSTASGARTNLGLGSSAILNTGTTSGLIPVIGASGMTANQWCSADVTGAINCNEAPPSSPWTVSGSDIYFTAGKVGIGTNAPISPFHFATTTGNADAVITSTTGNAELLLTGPSGSSYPGAAMSYINASGNLQFTKVTNGSPSTYPWAIFNGVTGIYTFTAITGASAELKMSLQRGNGLSPVISGTPIARISFDGYNGTTYSNSAAAIQGIAAETYTSTFNGTHLLFLTTPNGSNTPLEKMRIDQAGNVGIGISTPSTKLQVAGVISPSIDNTYTLGDSGHRFTSIYSFNSTINTSDLRLKKNIKDSDLGMNFINQLRPVSYHWKTGADHKIHYGLIAQETEQVLKNIKNSSYEENQVSFVDYDQDSDQYGIRYTELISPLIKASQDLYKDNLKLKEEISKLKENKQTETELIKNLIQKNQEMNSRIDKLEQLITK